MGIKQSLINELEVLMCYSLDTTQEGIKVHHTAGPERIEAVASLFQKGLITQKDGGYLTDLGLEAVDHLQRAINIITS